MGVDFGLESDHFEKDYFGSPFWTVIGAEWFNLGDRFASKVSSKITLLAWEWCTLRGQFASKLSSKNTVLAADCCAKTVNFVGKRTTSDPHFGRLPLRNASILLIVLRLNYHAK